MGASMMLAATIAVLLAWFAFVWIVDPDGFGKPRRAAHRRPK
jgi:hypothetical protein